MSSAVPTPKTPILRELPRPCSGVGVWLESLLTVRCSLAYKASAKPFSSVLGGLRRFNRTKKSAPRF